MTIREAINRCDTLKPNQYPDDQKITWLSELDSRIYNDIFLTHEDNPYVLVAEVTKENEIHFPYTDDATMLLAEEPYDVLYVSYLMAKIDESNEETTRYANSSAEYNSHYQDFARFYNRAHMPITKVFGHRPIPPIPPFPRDIDEHPSPTSKNPVMSCGIWAALQEKADTGAVPAFLAELADDQNHRTVSDYEKSVWNGKQDSLEFDTTPTAGSTNPVTSGGVKTALEAKADASDVPKYLQDLANLLISNPQENDVVTYKNGLWQNKPQSGGGGGSGSVNSVSVNGGTPALPDSNGNVNIDIVAYTSDNTMYVATIEDGDEVTYPND